MAATEIEKKAQALNQLIRTQGKKYGKNWRQRTRALLNQTFAALNAKPLDGALCLKLQAQIEAELQAVQNDTVNTKTGAVPESSGKRPGTPDQTPSGKDLDEKPGVWTKPIARSGERMDTGHSEPGETRMEPVSAADDAKTGEHSGVGATAPPKNIKKSAKNDHDEEVGLFDLIRIQIRTFFTIRACVRPPYIGKFVQFADRHGDIVQDRIDKFLAVLSQGEGAIQARGETEEGYREDLLPDMPDRNLILYPKKKKR